MYLVMSEVDGKWSIDYRSETEAAAREMAMAYAKSDKSWGVRWNIMVTKVLATLTAE